MISETTFQEIPFLPSYLKAQLRAFCPFPPLQVPIRLPCIPLLLFVFHGKLHLGIFYSFPGDYENMVVRMTCLKCQFFQAKSRMAEAGSFGLRKGFYFISAPGGGEEGGQRFRYPGLALRDPRQTHCIAS